ncbi:MAG: FAD-binding protein [Moorea sp. SIO2B7]|nr:FAD-binding protein [Moorena sp. SIO2B7]
MSWIRAEAVILATGGGGQVFAQTTNPAISTGDGVAIAWRAGAILRDLEFVQFHPTALTKLGAPHFLISEAVRGEGAHLIDSQGYRFAFDYHPSGELAPRDIVSRAIFSHLEKTATDTIHANVYLDLRPITPERIRYRFPNIIQVCKNWGIDVFSEAIPVAPAAHYWMGGIATDTMNRTSIPGLYAIGETASTGVHGANRLASNSLLECLVYAAQLSHLEIEPNTAREESQPLITEGEDWGEQIQQIISVRQELQSLVWHSAGICRSQAVLDEAITQVKSWREEFASTPITQLLFNLSPNQSVSFGFSHDPQKLSICTETLNLIDIGYLILKSAAFRIESRGGHYRSDYPQSSPHWQTHTLVRGDLCYKLPAKE